jgi:uncharacterized protein YkwD
MGHKKYIVQGTYPISKGVGTGRPVFGTGVGLPVAGRRLPVSRSAITYALSALIVMVFLGMAALPVAAQDVAGDLLGRINNLRGSRGLPGYTINGALAGAAADQARWMVDNGCAIAHVRPDGSSPRTRAAAFGYQTTDVSENIYCGSNAITDNAWTFWLNSGIHFAGLVNTRYKEIGIASARGAGGQAFVLVFGNPGGPAFVPPAPAGADGEAAVGPPAYVLGLDEDGNILHEVQPGDTLGDIMLIYGYTWTDIPRVLALNGLTERDIRDLAIGNVLLIPPRDGTYTPTPGDSPTPQATLAAPVAVPPNPPTGAVLREVWLNLPGVSITDLTGNPRYGDPPDLCERLEAMQLPLDAGDSYGARLRAYLVPPTTGDYTFWVSGDDAGQLWLSANSNPLNRRLIASFESWTPVDVWEAYPSQRSSAIALEAGQPYYIEFLLKEGDVGDYGAVAWQGPGIERAVIAGAYLSTEGMGCGVPVALQASATPTERPTEAQTPGESPVPTAAQTAAGVLLTATPRPPTVTPRPSASATVQATAAPSVTAVPLTPETQAGSSGPPGWLVAALAVQVVVLVGAAVVYLRRR